MHEVKKMLERELESITKSGNLDPRTLDTLGKVLDALKDIETIDAMGYSNEYSRDGYARDGYARDGYARDGYARDGYARDYANEYSGRRRRNSMGQYSREYSGDMVSELEDMMKDAPKEEREEIRNKLSRLMQRY